MRRAIARERASRAGRVESQPDCLRCNWRAHYLVLSHRDNYPRGRFHRAPSLKHDDVTRRAGSSFYEIFRFFFKRVSERASTAEGIAAGGVRRKTAGYVCAVLRSPIYTKHRLRVDEGLEARSLSLSLSLLCLTFARYTRHFYSRRLSSPRGEMLENSVCATVSKTHKKCIIPEILFR